MTTRGSRASVAGWLTLALLLAAQYVLFRAAVEREIAWGYPRMWDQAGFLSQVYGFDDVARREGLGAALGQAWHGRFPQGMLMPFLAVPLLAGLGASRLNALTLIFLHHALLQVLIVALLRRLTGGFTAPALAIGLLLASQSPAHWGGLFDFRLDFMAQCLYGVWLLAALQSDTFARRRGALVAGAVGGLLVLLRYVALAYTLGTLAAFAFVELLVSRGEARRARLRGLAWSTALLVAVAGPVLFASRAHLRAYYWAGHVEQGATLAAAAGIHTRAQAWGYYPRSLAVEHAGTLYLTLAALLVCGGAFALRAARAGRAPSLPACDLGAAARLLGCAALVPISILMLDTAKSPIVVGVTVPALSLLLVWPAVALLRQGRATRALGAAAALVLAAGAAHHARFLRAPGPLRDDWPTHREATRLHELLARVSIEQGWRRPIMLFDSLREDALPWSTAVLAYERYGQLIDPLVPLGGSPWQAVTGEQIASLLQHAHFIVVAQGTPRRLPDDAAFERSVATQRARIAAACRAEFVRLDSFEVGPRSLAVWARAAPVIVDPQVPEREGWTWITRAGGLTVQASSLLLRARPRLRLDGLGRLEWVGGRLPPARAQLLIEGREPRVLAVEAASLGQRYALRVTLTPSWLDGAPSARVRFDFERGFRPSEVGLSDETRELVTATPQRARLQRASDDEQSLRDELSPGLPPVALADAGPCTLVTRRPRPQARAATGDFDGDGESDLLLRSEGEGRLRAWFLEHARCAAQAEFDPQPGAEWRVAAAADFDADGRTDLALQDDSNGQVTFWRLGGATGTQRLGEPLELVPRPQRMLRLGAAGDADADGRPDLLFERAGGLSVEVWTLDGTRRRDVIRPAPDSAGLRWVSAGAFDVDGDGRLDLLWQNPFTRRLVVWWLGPGGVRRDGRFTTPDTPEPGTTLGALVGRTPRQEALLAWARERPASVELWRLGRGARRQRIERLRVDAWRGWRLAGPR